MIIKLIMVTMAIMVILVIIVTMVIGILTHQANLNEFKKILSERGRRGGSKAVRIFAENSSILEEEKKRLP